jgi:uncharacterized protein
MRLCCKKGFIRRYIAGASAIVACFIFSAGASSAVTPEPPKMPHTYVVDLAGIIPGNYQAQLNSYLRELEVKTSAQAIVLTIRSLDGDDINDFTQRTFEKWKLGKKGKDNGLLIVISLKDRKYRFHTGYGMEGVLPDSLLGSIGREYFVPNFKKGDYGAGIYSGTMACIQTIAKAQGVEIAGMPRAAASGVKYRKKQSFNWTDLIWIAIGIVFFVPFLIFRLLRSFTGRRYYGGGGGYWYGGGGGSFGGGGDSGFGGGGGGDSGGGGAGGDW